MPMIKTQVISADDASALLHAGQMLAAGHLVVFPTETVYGLGAYAGNDEAVLSIYQAKGRPLINPLIIHVASLEAALSLADFSEKAYLLARHFWPGPLTLVLPKRSDCILSSFVSAGRETIAIRIPDHPVALAILQAAAVPVAAPSANISGAISPTTAAHVLDGLDGKVAYVVDGGPCRVGIESTILDMTRNPCVVLRPGGLSIDEISFFLKEDVLSYHPSSTQDEASKRDGLLAPGMMTSHYAPIRFVRLNALNALPTEAYLGFGPDPDGFFTLNLSPRGSVEEAATHLFAMLRSLDREPFTAIAVAPIPCEGVGAALNDRLQRAAAPRPSKTREE